MHPRFDPILFDLDGTLIDSGQDLAAAINRTLRSLGLSTLPAAEIISFVGDGIRKLVERTLARTGRGDLEETIQLVRADYRAHCLDRTTAFPGIAALLRDLPPARVGVVTNKPVEFARAVIAGLDLAAALPVVVGGDETPALKPDPGPIALALARLGAPAGRGIMVGDSVNDIQAGRAAGLRTCGVGWGFDAGASLDSCAPDHRVATVAELRALLLGGAR
jgi:phosphoglycolate phosphatase